MKVVQFNFIVLLCVTVWDQISAGEVVKGNDVEDSKVRLDAWIPNPAKPNIQKRQTETTTPKPKKPRPSNIFSLISVLLTETRDDASRAFNEIGTLFNGQFTNTTTPKVSTTTTTELPAAARTEGDEEDNEITTTTEPYRISRDEFFGILRSNVQGIRNLFGKEFRNALQDSNQNVREFGRDLGVALRPYFYTNSRNNTKRNT